MKPSAKRLVGILTSLLLLMGALMVYSSLVVPKYKEIQILRGERAAKTNLLRDESGSVEAVKRLLDRYESISSLRDNINLTLPNEEEVAAVVNQIQGISSSNGMLLNSLSIKPLSVMANKGETDGVKPVGSMRVLVEMMGGYDSLETFLGALETNIRIMDVYSLQVTEGGTNGPYKYQMEIDTYYQL
jgi:Tfp pilus assembly protein PilO